MLPPLRAGAAVPPGSSPRPLSRSSVSASGQQGVVGGGAGPGVGGLTASQRTPRPTPPSAAPSSVLAPSSSGALSTAGRVPPTRPAPAPPHSLSLAGSSSSLASSSVAPSPTCPLRKSLATHAEESAPSSASALPSTTFPASTSPPALSPASAVPAPVPAPVPSPAPAPSSAAVPAPPPLAHATAASPTLPPETPWYQLVLDQASHLDTNRARALRGQRVLVRHWSSEVAAHADHRQRLLDDAVRREQRQAAALAHEAALKQEAEDLALEGVACIANPTIRNKAKKARQAQLLLQDHLRLQVFAEQREQLAAALWERAQRRRMVFSVEHSATAALFAHYGDQLFRETRKLVHAMQTRTRRVVLNSDGTPLVPQTALSPADVAAAAATALSGGGGGVGGGDKSGMGGVGRGGASGGVGTDDRGDAAYSDAAFVAASASTLLIPAPARPHARAAAQLFLTGRASLAHSSLGLALTQPLASLSSPSTAAAAAAAAASPSNFTASSAANAASPSAASSSPSSSTWTGFPGPGVTLGRWTPRSAGASDALPWVPVTRRVTAAAFSVEERRIRLDRSTASCVLHVPVHGATLIHGNLRLHPALHAPHTGGLGPSAALAAELSLYPYSPGAPNSPGGTGATSSEALGSRAGRRGSASHFTFNLSLGAGGGAGSGVGDAGGATSDARTWAAQPALWGYAHTSFAPYLLRVAPQYSLLALTGAGLAANGATPTVSKALALPYVDGAAPRAGPAGSRRGRRRASLERALPRRRSMDRAILDSALAGSPATTPRGTGGSGGDAASASQGSRPSSVAGPPEPSSGGSGAGGGGSGGGGAANAAAGAATASSLSSGVSFGLPRPDRLGHTGAIAEAENEYDEVDLVIGKEGVWGLVNPRSGSASGGSASSLGEPESAVDSALDPDDVSAGAAGGAGAGAGAEAREMAGAEAVELLQARLEETYSLQQVLDVVEVALNGSLDVAEHVARQALAGLSASALTTATAGTSGGSSAVEHHSLSLPAGSSSLSTPPTPSSSSSSTPTASSSSSTPTSTSTSASAVAAAASAASAVVTQALSVFVLHALDLAARRRHDVPAPVRCAAIRALLLRHNWARFAAQLGPEAAHGDAVEAARALLAEARGYRTQWGRFYWEVHPHSARHVWMVGVGKGPFDAEAMHGQPFQFGGAGRSKGMAVCSDGSLVFNTTLLPQVIRASSASASASSASVTLSEYASHPYFLQVVGDTSDSASAAASASMVAAAPATRPRGFTQELEALGRLSDAAVVGFLLDLLSGTLFLALNDGPFAPVFGADAMVWPQAEREAQAVLLRSQTMFPTFALLGHQSRAHFPPLSPSSALSSAASPAPSPTHAHVPTPASAGLAASRDLTSAIVVGTAPYNAYVDNPVAPLADTPEAFRLLHPELVLRANSDAAAAASATSPSIAGVRPESPGSPGAPVSPTPAGASDAVAVDPGLPSLELRSMAPDLWAAVARDYVAGSGSASASVGSSAAAAAAAAASAAVALAGSPERPLGHRRTGSLTALSTAPSSPASSPSSSPLTPSALSLSDPWTHLSALPPPQLSVNLGMYPFAHFPPVAWRVAAVDTASQPPGSQFLLPRSMLANFDVSAFRAAVKTMARDAPQAGPAHTVFGRRGSLSHPFSSASSSAAAGSSSSSSSSPSLRGFASASFGHGESLFRQVAELEARNTRSAFLASLQPPALRSWSHFPPQEMRVSQAVLVIQRAWRRHVASLRRAGDFRKRIAAAIVLQRFFRARLQRRLVTRNAAATRIQAFWRGYKARKLVSTFAQLRVKPAVAHAAATKIQAMTRRMIARKLARSKAIILQEQVNYITGLVVFVQAVWRHRIRVRRAAEAQLLASTSQGATAILRPLVQNPSHAVSIIVFMRLLSDIRVRNRLATVDKTVARMVQDAREAHAQLAARFRALVRIQRAWRQHRIRVQAHRERDALLHSICALRDAARRHWLLRALRDRYPAGQAEVLANVFDRMRWYPPIPGEDAELTGAGAAAASQGIALAFRAAIS